MCSHSLGGSTTTAHKFFIFDFKSGLVLKAFSLGEAKKKQLSSIQFILALCCASIIASSTISIQTKSDQIQFFSRLIHMVHVQQYRSNMVHFTYHNISCAFENNFCAQNVFV
ncbi:MAG: hypothetical protein WCG25_01070 [bacterium]